MHKSKIYYFVIVTLFFCCCSKDRNIWTPKFSLKEAERRLLSDCGTMTPPVFPQTIKAIIPKDPYNERLREVENHLKIPPLCASDIPKGVREIRIIIGEGYLYPQFFFSIDCRCFYCQG